MTAKRERVVRWSDPKELEAGARRMSGREFLTAIRECHFTGRGNHANEGMRLFRMPEKLFGYLLRLFVPTLCHQVVACRRADAKHPHRLRRGVMELVRSVRWNVDCFSSAHDTLLPSEDSLQFTSCYGPDCLTFGHRAGRT